MHVIVGQAYLHTEVPPDIHRDCCDGGKNGYCGCDAYPGMFCGSLTM